MVLLDIAALVGMYLLFSWTGVIFALVFLPFGWLWLATVPVCGNCGETLDVAWFEPRLTYCPKCGAEQRE
jgi:hypothetical protein